MKRMLCVLAVLALTLGAVCSASAAAVVYGDVNGDGRVNNRDLGLLQQYLNGWEAAVDRIASDVNDDTRINNRDLGLLQQYLNGWDVRLGPDEPAVELPPAGYDPDGRGVLTMDTLLQDSNTISVHIVNHSTLWMTEETSYVEYTCTDTAGNVLTLDNPYYGTLYFGMLEVGEDVTLTITLPAGTAKVTFGDYRIVYWSQWA